jgi:hypothetical protein
MPIFELERDGKTFEVDAPDMHAAVRAIMPSEPSKPSAPVTFEGSAKAFGTGVKQGVVGLAGLPADAIYGARWLARKAGLPTVETPLPGSEEIGAAVNKVVPDYEPQNITEEYLRTGGQFVAAAPAGAGGFARRAAQIAIPAVASETGGQVGRMISPEAEVVGRVGGALLGGRGVTNPRAPKGPASTDAIRDASQDNYAAAKAAGLEIKGDSFFNFAQNLSRDAVLRSLKLNPTLHPKLSALVSDIASTVKGPPSQSPMAAMTGVQKQWNPKNIDLEEFDNLRRNALAAKRSADPDERRVAGHIIERMDAYFDNLKAADVAAGNPREAARTVREARSLWRRYRKADDIDTIMEVAKDRAGQFSVSGN